MRVLLEYRMLPREDKTEYVNAPPVADENEDFSLCLDSGVLIVEMKKHHPSINDVKDLVQKYLDKWIIHSKLKSGTREPRFREPRFEFNSYDILEPSPQPPPQEELESEPHGVLINATAQGLTGGMAELDIKRSRYPEPPSKFEFSLDVDTLCYRYQAYLREREPLQSMVYFCITVVELRFEKCRIGKEQLVKVVARYLNISINVLKKMRVLSSQHGDKFSARKAIGINKPLIYEEKRKLEDMVKRLILRMGEYEYWRRVEELDPGEELDPDDIPAKLDEITMADFT